MEKDDRPLMVAIKCLAYNHEPYIRQCLDGFVKQKTTFRFVAIVHDDASTDRTAEIIKEYELKYPAIIKPIYEITNLYKRDLNKLREIMNNACQEAKYTASCEGDDYWTDPFKLQKQYDMMESHPECSCCFHAHVNIYPSGKKEIAHPFDTDKMLSPEDVINIGDGMVVTASTFTRTIYLKDGMPSFWVNCPVGDLPQRLFFVSKGNFAYINDVMSVYRYSTPGSWSGSRKGLKNRINHLSKMLDTFQEFDEYSSGNYHSVIGKEKKLIYVEMVKLISHTIVKTLLPKRVVEWIRGQQNR